MARYDYECVLGCGRFELDFPLGAARPTARCAQGHLARRVYLMPAISAHALANKGEPVRRIDQKEARWDRDLPAYRRMRRRGLQPKNIDGCARLEDRVGDQTDIQWGHLYRYDGGKQRVVEALDQVEQMKAEGADGLELVKSWKRRDG